MQAELAQFECYLRKRYAGRSTAKHYMSALAICSDLVKDTSPAAVDVKQMDAFVAAQSAQGLKAATINRRLAAIASFYAFLIGETEDEQLRNPVLWKRPSLRQGRPLPRDVQDAILTQLFAVIDDPRDRAMFEWLLGAGR